MPGLQLTQQQIDELDDDVSDGLYYQGYLDVLSFIAQAPSNPLDARTMTWYTNAPLINDPNGSSAAKTFVRDVTSFGLQLDGHPAPTATAMQEMSNSIATAVLNSITDAGEIITLSQLVNQDVSVVLRDYGATIAGWGGSFYYWNETVGTQSIGTQILASLDEKNKFIAANGAAFADTVLQEPGTVLHNVYNYVINSGAEVPFEYAQKIANRAASLMLTGGAIVGDPNVIDGYTYTPGGWLEDGAYFSEFGVTPTYAPADIAGTLDAQRAYRINHDSVTLGSAAATKHAEVYFNNDSSYSVVGYDGANDPSTSFFTADDKQFASITYDADNTHGTFYPNSYVVKIASAPGGDTALTITETQIPLTTEQTFKGITFEGNNPDAGGSWATYSASYYDPDFTFPAAGHYDGSGLLPETLIFYNSDHSLNAIFDLNPNGNFWTGVKTDVVYEITAKNPDGSQNSVQWDLTTGIAYEELNIPAGGGVSPTQVALSDAPSFQTYLPSGAPFYLEDEQAIINASLTKAAGSASAAAMAGTGLTQAINQTNGGGVGTV